MRILVVDDELSLAENVAEILADAGHHAHVATSAAGAAEILDKPIDFAHLLSLVAAAKDGDLATYVRKPTA